MAKQFIEFADSLRGALPPRPASAAAFSAASDGPPPPTPPSGNLAMPPPPAAVPTVEDFVRAERPVGSHLRSFSQGANPMQGTPREEKTGGGRVADAMQVVRPPSRGGVPPSDSGGVPGRNERGQYEPPVSGKKSTRYVCEQELELDPNDRPKPSEPEGSWIILVPSGYDRWRMSMKDRNGKLIDESVLHTIAFNGLITALKDKIYQKGPFAVTNHFQALDLDGSGSLDPHEFFKALETMNLGPGLNQQVSDMLLRAVDKDASGTIDYVEFTDAIRMGRVDYIKPPLKARCGPDPDMPFGDIKQRMPWGVMKDADRNLEAFDKKINSMFRDLESVFERFDTDGSGEIDYNEFTHAMRELNRKKGLNI
ncbi:MAG: EF-hand domain-containing protein, partial [Pseudomonadota bacterium]|nr:EF-hand domain-containing protein [Pseudomonadota bacterium]